jgi:hypothetical protein
VLSRWHVRQGWRRGVFKPPHFHHSATAMFWRAVPPN